MGGPEVPAERVTAVKIALRLLKGAGALLCAAVVYTIIAILVAVLMILWLDWLLVYGKERN